MGFGARVLADSVSPDGVRLTTMEVTFPRIVLAEFNTHRMFSRNSASSRAIPIATMLRKVQDDPFIPIWWGKNQKGMEAEVELDPMAKVKAEAEWLKARDNAVRTVQRMQLDDIDLHKQIANRLLEPWLWHTVICTATEWDNFRGLRCHKAAQPEMRRGAEYMMAALDSSKPKPLDYEQWHLPLMQKDEIVLPENSPEWNEPVGFECHMMSPGFAVKVSSGRCARVSYLTHDGKRDPNADVELHDRLLANGHMSPFEHCARPMTKYDIETIVSKFSGVTGFDKLDLDPRQHFLGNFRGWVQYRKLLAHEANFLARPAK